MAKKDSYTADRTVKRTVLSGTRTPKGAMLRGLTPPGQKTQSLLEALAREMSGNKRINKDAMYENTPIIRRKATRKK